MVLLVVLVVPMFPMVLVHSSSNGSIGSDNSHGCGGSKDCCRSGSFNGYGSSGCFEGRYKEGLSTKVYKRATEIAS